MQHQKIRTLCLAFILIIGSNLLMAQTAIQDSINLNEVVITGSKTSRLPGNITQKIDMISNSEAQMIVLGQNNIAEVIAQKPGVSVSALSRNDANWGTYAGIGPKYSTFMLNGLPLDAFVDPMNLELMAFERIEIQRGPASVLYPNYLSQDFAGNQSPLAGTINLIGRQRVDRQLSTASMAYGSYNTLNGQLYHQDAKDNLHYFAGLTYETSDYTNYGIEGSWLNMNKDPEYTKRKLFAGATHYFGVDEAHKLSVFVNQTAHKGDAGRSYRGFDHNYTTVNVNQTSTLNSFMVLNAGFGLRVYDRNWQESSFMMDSDIEVLDSNNGAYQRILPADINLTISHGKKHAFIVGTDFQSAAYHTHSDPLQGFKSFGNKSRSAQYGLYAQEEIFLNNLILRGGLRYNHIRNTIDMMEGGKPGEPQSDWSRLLFSLGAKYHITSNVDLYANIGNSFMTPGLKSIGGTIPLSDRNQPGRNGHLPNPNLKPESGMGMDLGTNMNLSNLKIGLRGFYNIIDDAIIDVAVSEVPSQSQSINAGKTNAHGLEIEIEHVINTNISWYYNNTIMNSRIKNSSDPEQHDANVPFAPELVANIGFTIKSNSGLTIRPVLNYTGKYYDSSSLTLRNDFTPGTIINLYASQQLVKKPGHQIELFTQMYNITNNRYEMPWQFRNTGLSMMAGIRVFFE